jgi:hypothetical protein
MPTRQGVNTEPARLDEDDEREALLRMWAAGLAHSADRPEVRKLVGGLLVVLEECERLRRAGREAMAPVKVIGMLLGGLKARGCQPPA